MLGIVDKFVEVEPLGRDDFLKVRETLTRIGVAVKRTKTLYQSCYVLQKRGRYYIVHFKEMLALDGLPTDFSESDLARRNAIAWLLDKWGLVSVVDKTRLEPAAPPETIGIIKYSEKAGWKLVPKYEFQSAS